MGERLILFGAGGHAKVALEALVASRPGCDFAILDDAPQLPARDLLGRRVVGGREWLVLNWPDVEVFPAIGANGARADLLKWIEECGRHAASIIHPAAHISPSAIIERGVFLAPGAIVNAETRLEAGVIVNTGASVDHDCRIGRASHVAPGSHLCGGVLVGERTLIGAGSTIIPGVRIGSDAVVGAGAVVTADVPDHGRVAGVPARSMNRA